MADNSLPFAVELKHRIMGLAGFTARLACKDFAACGDAGRHTLTFSAPEGETLSYVDRRIQSSRIRRMLQRSPNLHHLTFHPLASHLYYVDLKALKHSTRLRSLCLGEGTVDRYDGRENLDVLGSLTHLTRLETHGLQSVQPLARLSNLAHFSLRYGEPHGLLDLTAGCPGLSHIDFTGCTPLQNVDALATLGGALLTLNLSGCSGVTDVSVLAAACVNLADMSVCNSGVTSLLAFSHSRGMRVLGMHPGFTDVEALELPLELTVLDVTGCIALTRPPTQPGSHWTLLGCVGELGVETVIGRRSRSLQCFRDLDKHMIRDLSALMDHSSLTEVVLDGCDNLSDVSGVASCSNLQALNLSDCRAICVLPHSPAFLRCLGHLEELDLAGTGLTDIGPLSSCCLLRSCDLSFTPVVSLVPLSACEGLKRLFLRGCRELTDLGPLSSCTSLTVLDIRGCNSILDTSALDTIALANWPKLRVWRDPTLAL